MKDTEAAIAIATIVEALQDPTFRKWRIERYGRIVDMPGGCVAEIQDDGALVCIACSAPHDAYATIEWMDP